VLVYFERNCVDMAFWNRKRFARGITEKGYIGISDLYEEKIHTQFHNKVCFSENDILQQAAGIVAERMVTLDDVPGGPMWTGCLRCVTRGKE
jgi:hypothetical protein